MKFIVSGPYRKHFCPWGKPIGHKDSWYVTAEGYAAALEISTYPNGQICVVVGSDINRFRSRLKAVGFCKRWLTKRRAMFLRLPS